MKYDGWILDILNMTPEEFHIEESTIVFQWAKFEDPEQNITVEIIKE